MTNFNPNDIGIANGNYFGLPYSIEESKVVLVSAPWDVTTSYRAGTHKGPQAIMDASLQIDLFDQVIPKAWETAIATHPIDKKILKLSKKNRKIAERIIADLEKGGKGTGIEPLTDIVNQSSAHLNKLIYNTCLQHIKNDKIVGVIGGDHSVPLGNMKAIANKYDDFGILHIDAHADLRIAYEGFKYSHASIMYNALNEIPQLAQLTQVGIRDFCHDEDNLISTDHRIRSFTDFEIRKASFEGRSWEKQCDEIIQTLPNFVYVSFDIDGLSPDLCPNTGTPVPGGLSFREADYLLYKLSLSNKKIVGFDICEVAPGKDSEWDANVGARILFKLSLYSANS